MAKKTFKALIRKARESDSFWIAKATLDFAEDFVRLMEQRRITKTALAKKIKSSPAYVTKALRGDTNFTIETMVRLVRAVDGQLCIHVGRKEDTVRWFDVVQQQRMAVVHTEDYEEIVKKAYVFDGNNLAANDESAIAA